jgi:hypothetical protein
MMTYGEFWEHVSRIVAAAPIQEEWSKRLNLKLFIHLN